MTLTHNLFVFRWEDRLGADDLNRLAVIMHNYGLDFYRDLPLNVDILSPADAAEIERILQNGLLGPPMKSTTLNIRPALQAS